MASKTAASNVATDIDALLLQQKPYFVGKPEVFQQSADVLLVLDSKEELPVHSAFLCAHSSVFCEILTATRPGDGASPLRRLPLSECTEEEVNALLLCLYAENPSEFLSIKTARAVSQLAHKFGLQGTLRMCDSFFLSKADGDAWTWNDLWDRDLSKGVEWLVWAETYGLPQLVARARKYVLEDGGSLSACPALDKVSRESLLWLLEARHIQKCDVQLLNQKNDKKTILMPPGLSSSDTYAFYRWSRSLPRL